MKNIILLSLIFSLICVCSISQEKIDSIVINHEMINRFKSCEYDSTISFSYFRYMLIEQNKSYSEIQEFYKNKTYTNKSMYINPLIIKKED